MIYAIADLHLSFSDNKPMDIFGKEWEGHAEKIEKNWRAVVREGDTVLIPGDISWAMNLDDALNDFMFIEALPGKKIILKGNHDYWWDTVSKIKAFFSKNGIQTIELLHNNSFKADNAVICGTRGWILKSGAGFTAHDLKIYTRELGRLKMSLASSEDKAGLKIVMLHFPPIGSSKYENEFTDIMREYDIDICLFGHIHSGVPSEEHDCHIGKTRYKLVSGDHLGFRLFTVAGK